MYLIYFIASTSGNLLLLKVLYYIHKQELSSLVKVN